MVQPELRELYQELILEHSKKPRNFRVPEGAKHMAEGFNPLCGDKIKLYLELEGGRIQDLGFQGSGCAISKASASMMTVSVKGKTEAEARELFSEFHKMLSGGVSPAFDFSKLGRLSVFSGVSEFPVRIKCATLAWHTLRAAMDSNGHLVSTES